MNPWSQGHCASFAAEKSRQQAKIPYNVPTKIQQKSINHVPLYVPDSRAHCQTRSGTALCLSTIKSGHIRAAIRRGVGGKEYASPSSRCAIEAHPSKASECAGFLQRDCPEQRAAIATLNRDATPCPMRDATLTIKFWKSTGALSSARSDIIRTTANGAANS